MRPKLTQNNTKGELNWPKTSQNDPNQTEATQKET